MRPEVRTYYGTTNWVNVQPDSLVVQLSANQPWVKVSRSEMGVAPGDTLQIPFELDLRQQLGLVLGELQVSTDSGIVLQRVALEGLILSPEPDVLKAYRHDLWPFSFKSRVFNLGAGFTNQSLHKEFLLYNFSGKDIDLTGAKLDHEGYHIQFSPR